MARPKKIKTEEVKGTEMVSEVKFVRRPMVPTRPSGSIAKPGFDPDLPENKQRYMR